MMRILLTLAVLFGVSRPTHAAESFFPKNEAGPSLPEEKAEKNARAEEEIKKIAPTIPRVMVAPGRYKSAIFDTFRTPKVVQGRYFWMSLGYDGSPLVLRNMGLQASLGYQRDLIGPVLKFRYARAHYGQFTVKPSSADLSSTALSVTSSDSEYNRFRPASDPWSALCLDLGIQINGSLMSDWIPNSSQRGTFTMGYGRWSDEANSLGFGSFQFGFEAAFQYHFTTKSRFAIELAGTFTAGWMSIGGLMEESTRIPIAWPTAGINFLIFL